MSNCHVQELSRLYEHLFEDVSTAYPTLRVEFQKDLTRLQFLVKHRGIGVYLRDLPALAKHLDRCLAQGKYVSSTLPLSAVVSKRIQIPKFLRGLYLLVFHEDGHLKEDPDVEAVFFLRQLMLVAKKTTLRCSDDAVLDEIRDFVNTDSTLPVPEREWEAVAVADEELKVRYAGFGVSALLQERIAGSSDEPTVRDLLKNLDLVSGILISLLGHYDPNEWNFRHGPGAISQATGPVNKYKWFNWSERLDSVFPISDVGYYSYTSWVASSGGDGIGSDDPCSRLIAVPKTITKPRLIAAEPSEHQFCQQNIWHYLCDRTRDTLVGKFVRFRDQTLNQDLCLSGSRDGSLCTMDLSSASDRVTCHVVGQMFRGNLSLLQSLRATRTRFVKIGRDEFPAKLELRKFSTMGSACTFPVQSLIFLSVALAATLYSRGLRVTVRNIEDLVGKVAVFGDDLIFPSDSRELVQRLLEVLYFKVNEGKTFSVGNFRESCGVDAFRGVSITPAYWHGPCTGKPDSIASTVEVCNNFYKRFLLKTSAYLASTVREGGIPHVSTESGVFGFISRVRPRESGYITRFNRSLQRMEARVLTISGKCLRHTVEDDSQLLQYFTEAPSPYTFWKAGFAERPKVQKRLRWVPLEDLAAQQDLLVEVKLNSGVRVPG